MMYSRQKTTLLIFLFFIISNLSAFSQRTGNIVEYFGKEKVEDISEGEVLHIFKRGLYLQVPGFGFNSSSFPKDPVFNRFLMNEEAEVKEDDVFSIDYEGNEMVWKPLKVDTSNTFTGNELRSSYVYLNYKSRQEEIVLFEASGHSLVSINGMPHEGDHYDFGYSLIPVRLKKGENTFVLKVGRFPRVRARLLKPHKEVQFTTRDLTMPDLLKDKDQLYYGAIRVINASENWVEGGFITAEVQGKKAVAEIIKIPPLSVYKLPVKIPSIGTETSTDKETVHFTLSDQTGTVDDQDVVLNVKSKNQHHKKTFVSEIDGSIQYYSVAPSTTGGENQALFLSVHGASVEAVNQANAYKQKSWGNLIAPTNRRPFGFAWEDWGRLDALEVLNDAKHIYNPDPQKIYLTGHSMGGHGTWYLGATYPDHFAAIAPCAGYPDLLAYRDSFKERMKDQAGSDNERLKRLFYEPNPTEVEKLITRAGNPSRTLELIKNYLHFGVYILHGEIDNVVPTFIARDMRERLGKFHPDFTYYEYPGGTHWYGDHSVDWEPIFDFFKRRTIQTDNDIKKIEFSTSSPGVSASSHYVTIHQQIKPFEISTFKLIRGENIEMTTENISLLSVDLNAIDENVGKIIIDGQEYVTNHKAKLYFEKRENGWSIRVKPPMVEKGPHRNGGFKDAFRNNVVFVYATGGSKEENDWYYNKALFDAETFYYKANGKVEMIPDSDFDLKDYLDRNVVVYGNRNNNKAWKKLLKYSPIQVFDDMISVEGKELRGEQWGTYFITRREDSNTASIGVVSATGLKGMKAIYANNYLVNGTSYPDVTIFDDSVLKYGSSAVKCAGFFGKDWSVKTGDFEWK